MSILLFLSKKIYVAREPHTKNLFRILVNEDNFHGKPRIGPFHYGDGA